MEPLLAIFVLAIEILDNVNTPRLKVREQDFE